MPFFNASQKVVSAVCREIADAAGASADDEQVQRAGRSLNASIQHFNNKANWVFAETEAPPITVFAPFAFGLVSASAGETSALVSAGHGLRTDDQLLGTGIFRSGTRITATANTSIGFSYAFSSALTGLQQLTLTATAQRDRYDAPSDWKAEYSAVLLVSQRPLYMIRQRQKNRSTANESLASSPLRYDVFYIGSKGKVALVASPAQGDVLQLRYYRRMTTWGTGVTATAGLLDIPEDYESYQIAWAKWHYLTDKRDASEQAATWLAFAEGGIKTMLSDQTRRPDEDLMMIPGAAYGSLDTPNSTRNIDWEFS